MKCPACGADAIARTRVCTACAAAIDPGPAAGSVPPPLPADALDPAVPERGPGLIPTRNPQALVGYYCAIFGLVPLVGLPLSIAAVALGVSGLRRVRRDPNVRGTAHAWVAIVLGSVATVLWGGAITWMATR